MIAIIFKHAEYFVLDGVNFNSEYGIKNININNSLFNDQLLPFRTLYETKVRNNSKPFFHRIEPSPYEFEISFYFEDGWDEAKIREIARIIFQEKYVEMYFSTDTNKVFNVICINDPRIVHNGLSQGYVTLTFRCDSPYAYKTTETVEYLSIAPTFERNSVAYDVEGNEIAIDTEVYETI